MCCGVIPLQVVVSVYVISKNRCSEPPDIKEAMAVRVANQSSPQDVRHYNDHCYDGGVLGVHLMCESLALCQAGEYNSANGTCHPCPEGTFMNRSDHTQTECDRCGCADVTGREDVTVLINCTRSNEAVCACVSGMFNVDTDQIVCQLCTRCTGVEVRKCSAHSDAVCQTESPFISTEQQYSTESKVTASSPPNVPVTTTTPKYKSKLGDDTPNSSNENTTYVIMAIAAIVLLVIGAPHIKRWIEGRINQGGAEGPDFIEGAHKKIRWPNKGFLKREGRKAFKISCLQ
ncbi:hypothetical protein Btru_043266 [Bulinus truncatus]|nr:hypothetical protein Btru_043266 [Bulinus truncatus]